MKGTLSALSRSLSDDLDENWNFIEFTTIYKSRKLKMIYRLQLDLDRNRKLETILQRRLRFSFIGIEKYFYFKQIAGTCYLIWEKSMHTWWIIELWAVWMDSTVTHKLHVVIILGISTIFFWLELTLHDLGLFWYVRQFSIC